MKKWWINKIYLYSNFRTLKLNWATYNSGRNTSSNFTRKSTNGFSFSNYLSYVSTNEGTDSPSSENENIPNLSTKPKISSNSDNTVK